MLISILNNETNQYSAKDIEEFILQYELLLGKTIINEAEEIIDGLLLVYCEILISLSKFPVAEESTCRFLDNSFLNRFNVKKEKEIVWETNIAVALAKESKMLNIVLPWIIEYFSHSKTASVDLNRYKVEAFLMTCNNHKTNEMICNAIFDRNCYIREHMADIIGEKRLYEGADNLCKQLACEENYYSAVSIIEALGKLRSVNAVPYILHWLQDNESKIISEKQFFVLNHVRIALSKLVDITNDQTLTEFDQKYHKYLQDYFIL